MKKIQIERARIFDAEGICRLNREEMGYDYPLEQTKAQLESLLRDPAHAVFAARADGELAGYIHAHSYDLLYSPPLKNVLGIAVSARFRRMGIGRKLLEAVEEWAHAEGCAGVRLVSGASREGAHAFYRSCGYDGGKMQINFKKMWG